MEITLEQITDYISKLVDYIENFTIDCREKEYVIQKLEEAVFWITYMDDNKEG